MTKAYVVVSFGVATNAKVCREIMYGGFATVGGLCCYTFISE
ncbi:hypothetical protein [Listeria newyorkensis]|nr:hypothetical protein [Listeria newyorkensis]